MHSAWYIYHNKYYVLFFIHQDPIKRVNNYIKHRLEREKDIYNLIKESPNESVSEEDIVEAMYKVI